MFYGLEQIISAQTKRGVECTGYTWSERHPLFVRCFDFSGAGMQKRDCLSGKRRSNIRVATP